MKRTLKTKSKKNMFFNSEEANMFLRALIGLSARKLIGSIERVLHLDKLSIIGTESCLKEILFSPFFDLLDAKIVKKLIFESKFRFVEKCCQENLWLILRDYCKNQCFSFPIKTKTTKSNEMNISNNNKNNKNNNDEAILGIRLIDVGAKKRSADFSDLEEIARTIVNCPSETEDDLSEIGSKCNVSTSFDSVSNASSISQTQTQTPRQTYCAAMNSYDTITTINTNNSNNNDNSNSNNNTNNNNSNSNSNQRRNRMKNKRNLEIFGFSPIVTDETEPARKRQKMSRISTKNKFNDCNTFNDNSNNNSIQISCNNNKHNNNDNANNSNTDNTTPSNNNCNEYKNWRTLMNEFFLDSFDFETINHKFFASEIINSNVFDQSQMIKIMQTFLLHGNEKELLSDNMLKARCYFDENYIFCNKHETYSNIWNLYNRNNINMSNVITKKHGTMFRIGNEMCQTGTIATSLGFVQGYWKWEARIREFGMWHAFGICTNISEIDRDGTDYQELDERYYFFIKYNEYRKYEAAATAKICYNNEFVDSIEVTGIDCKAPIRMELDCQKWKLKYYQKDRFLGGSNIEKNQYYFPFVMARSRRYDDDDAAPLWCRVALKWIG